MIATGTADIWVYDGDLNNLRVIHSDGQPKGPVFRVSVSVEGDNVQAFDLLRRMLLLETE